MKTIRLLLALMAILMSNAMVNAKLTIAYVNLTNKFDVNLQYIAKIRQALTELYGEEWFKNSFKKFMLSPDRRYGSQSILFVYMGQGTELMLNGKELWEEDLLLKVKSAYDLLSMRNDTLYIATIFDEDRGDSFLKRESSTTFSHALYRPLANRLLVGNLYTNNVKLKSEFYSIFVSNLMEEYKKECKEKGYLSLIGYYNMAPEDISDEDIDFYFESLMKADKELLKQKVTSKAIISKFSYEYDERAEIRYIHEKQVPAGELSLALEKEDIDEKPKLDEERESE